MAVSKPALEQLGADIKVARGDLTLREVEARSGVNNATISMWENGRRLPRPADLDAVLDAIGVTDERRERILGLRRAAGGAPGQLAGGVPSIGVALEPLIQHEANASRIIDVAPLLIPGLLQISAYTRAIMGDMPSASTRVALRAGRREILTQRDPVEFVALIDSEVLVRPIAPSDVMIEQLRHLLAMGERPNVTIQLRSSTRPGFSPLLNGPVELIEFPQSPPIVLLEHYRSSVFLWEERDVREYIEAAEEIRKAAMTPAESAGVIEDIVNGMEKTT